MSDYTEYNSLLSDLQKMALVDYVAWCRYRRKPLGGYEDTGVTIETCNQGDEGAFRVYQETALDKCQERLLSLLEKQRQRDAYNTPALEHKIDMLQGELMKAKDVIAEIARTFYSDDDMGECMRNLEKALAKYYGGENE